MGGGGEGRGRLLSHCLPFLRLPVTWRVKKNVAVRFGVNFYDTQFVTYGRYSPWKELIVIHPSP